jgi:integrase
MATANRTQRLSKRVVDALKPGGLVWDADVTGFAVRCQQKAKVYVLKYRIAGRQRWYSIGKHGSPWTPEAARTEAKRLLGLVADGKDPAEVRENVAKDITVSELCDIYMAEAPFIILPRKGRPKKESSLAIDKSNIERHVKKLLGTKRVRTLTRNDIERFQQDVAAGKTAVDEKTGPRGRARVTGGKGTAARATALLGGIFTFAVKRDYRTDNPVKGVDLFKSEPRTRFLSADEMARLGDALAEAEGNGTSKTVIAAIRLLILTGCRKSEILGLRWEWIDFEGSCLRLPETKSGAKVIPIGAPALELLAALPRIEGNQHVLPGEKADGHLIGLPKAWAKIKKQAGLDDVRLHDLRHSFATVAVAGGDSLYLVGKVLGHRESRSTEVYAHAQQNPLLAVADRAATKIVAAMKAKPKKGAEVVDFKRNA